MEDEHLKEEEQTRGSYFTRRYSGTPMASLSKSAINLRCNPLDVVVMDKASVTNASMELWNLQCPS